MDKNELDKINSLTRREFTEKELYTFPVTLCDNDIDRDGEAFSDKALEQMKGFIVGKPGILDHERKSSNQTARLYDAEVVTDPEKKTAFGEPYKFLRGKAYTVRTDENKSLIAEIDAGIKKEVSVSCSANDRICSICGQNMNKEPCEHIKGREYDGKLCYHTLDDITDAYEWSFVAVPAQPRAGVTKKFDKEEKNMEEFKPITTQAALDEIVKAAVAEATGKFEGYISPEEHAKALEAAEAAQKSAEIKSSKLMTAIKAGLPIEFADRLSGTTEEEYKADAEKLAKFFRASNVQPMYDPDSGNELSGVEKAFYARNPDLKH